MIYNARVKRPAHTRKPGNMIVHVKSGTRKRKLQVVISESGQPNGRPYRACTTNGRQVNARSDAAAARMKGKREAEGSRERFSRYWERTKSLFHLAIHSARACETILRDREETRRTVMPFPELLPREAKRQKTVILTGRRIICKSRTQRIFLLALVEITLKLLKAFRKVNMDSKWSPPRRVDFRARVLRSHVKIRESVYIDRAN